MKTVSDKHGMDVAPVESATQSLTAADAIERRGVSVELEYPATQSGAPPLNYPVARGGGVGLRLDRFVPPEGGFPGSLVMGEQPAVVFVIDDDPSMRAALEDLVSSVGLQAQLFASP